jgi:hypothetical protein
VLPITGGSTFEPDNNR